MSQSRNRPSKAPHKAGGVSTNTSAYTNSIASESQADGEVAGNVELENQFILRLPTEPAKALREALRSGAGNIKVVNWRNWRFGRISSERSKCSKYSRIMSQKPF